ncbi:MAG: hypothetical protein J6K20_07815, partial [Thermoguttaceae bacterium]|nr:hypothetical protein [Thermoguttaceae bacterium]
ANAKLTLANATVKANALTIRNGATVEFNAGASTDATDGTAATVATSNTTAGTAAISNATDEINATDGANATNGTDATSNVTDATSGTAATSNAINATSGTAATYVDAILTATESASVGAATFTGAGYFAPPQGTDLTAATVAETIRVVDFGAGVETFAATATGPTKAKLAWSATNETARVCVERENAAAPNGWEVVATTPTEGASPLEVALSGKERFRIFDGATFTVDFAWFPTGDFYVYVADDISAVATVAVEWETATQLISAGNVMYRNENVLLLASVKNKLTAVYLSRDEVESATATVYAVSPGFGAREIWTPVDGWADVAVPLDAILEAPTEIDGWTLDAVGPNFVWTPDATTRPLFGDSGTFAVQVCVKRKSGGNPIYFTFRAVVK